MIRVKRAGAARQPNTSDENGQPNLNSGTPGCSRGSISRRRGGVWLIYILPENISIQPHAGPQKCLPAQVGLRKENHGLLTASAVLSSNDLPTAAYPFNNPRSGPLLKRENITWLRLAYGDRDDHVTLIVQWGASLSALTLGSRSHLKSKTRKTETENWVYIRIYTVLEFETPILFGRF